MEFAFKAQGTEEVSNTAAVTLATIGMRIRETRQKQSMTLQDLADASGISVSMLSLVERGRASPSIGSLIVVAEALGVAISEFVSDQPGKEDVVVRAADQRVVEHAKHVIRRLVRDDRKRAVSIAIADFPPNTDSTPTVHSHAGYEYGFVLEGKLLVEIDGVVYRVEKGDLISYSSRTRHRIWNPSKRSARTLWFNLKNT